MSQRTTREEFLARVREALQHERTALPSAPPPGVDQSLFRLASASDDLPALFTARATGVGMRVKTIAAAEVTRETAAVLAQINAKRIAVGVGSLPQGLGMKDALRRKGFEVVDWAATPGLEAQYDCDAGITDVHAALAETGTLVCCADAGHSRGLSLVPPVHIAIVRHSDILPDMIDFWNRVNAQGGPSTSSIAFITGPSKTADIEGVLITGVHGPGEVFVLLVRDA